MFLVEKIQADYLTMISVYLRVCGKNKSLLESIPTDKTKSRYSIIGVDPFCEITYEKECLTVGEKTIQTKDPLKEIANYILKKDDYPKDLDIPFCSGAIGYIGYDTAAIYEDLGVSVKDELNIPDIHLYVYETFLVYDHTKETLTVVVDNSYSSRSVSVMQKVLDDILNSLKTPSVQEFDDIKIPPIDFKSNLSEKEFIDIVEKSKKYIHEGDIFQIVPSQRFSAKFTHDAFSYYRQLRQTNPSPYLYFIDFGKTKIIGSSPESLVSLKNGIVTTNPIAGTIKRGETLEEDIKLSNELLSNEKELSEHRMLVDLGRNDIGKISKIGSVTTPVYLKIEKYRFVMHITSVVKGVLKDGLTAMDALRSTLPAGTVSGAPKIRAMQRIYELEGIKRNIYAGAVGYMSMNGNADFAIAIRTMVLHNDTAYIQAGAGVVHESDPKKEYLETLQKAQALLNVGK